MSEALTFFQKPQNEKSLAVETQQSRQIAEVQAAMTIAKSFPRDENRSYERIITACKRPTLAASAKYAFPRGGQTVEGPSIRLAEVLAQCWGNLDVGIVELEQRFGESTVMAYAWDLETNTREVKIFTVKHQRKARGEIKSLDDPRDIYEMNANQGARRLRSCILAVIPGDVVEAALQQCDKTLAGQSKEPLKDRVRKMVAMFADQGVTQEMITTKLGKNLDAITETDIVQLGKIYRSLHDGMSQAQDWFAPAAPAAQVKKAATKAEAKPEKTASNEQPELGQESPSDDANEREDLLTEIQDLTNENGLTLPEIDGKLKALDLPTLKDSNVNDLVRVRDGFASLVSESTK